MGTNNATYTPANAITATRYYRVYRTCSGAGDTSAVTAIALAGGRLLSTTPAARCGNGTVNLGATHDLRISTVVHGTAGWGTCRSRKQLYHTKPEYYNNLLYLFMECRCHCGGGDQVADFAICGFPENSSLIDQPLRFTTNKGVILNSVWIIPSSSSVTLALRRVEFYHEFGKSNLQLYGRPTGQPAKK